MERNEKEDCGMRGCRKKGETAVRNIGARRERETIRTEYDREM